MPKQSLHKTTAVSFDSAKRLRKDSTEAEVIFRELLRNRKLMGLKFSRREPLCGYTADFYCHNLQLIMEVNSGYHNYAVQQILDEDRSNFFRLKGLTVFQLINSQTCNPQLAIEMNQKFTASSKLPLLAGAGRGEVYE